MRPSIARAAAATAAASLLLLLGSLAAASLPPLPAYQGLVLTYEDDFLGAALNANVWTAVDGFVQTPYAQVCYRSDDVSLRDGLLVLTTRARATTCVFHDTGEAKNFGFTSGWVDTHKKLAVRNGLVEVSARLPPAVERIWPSAWVIDAANERDGAAAVGGGGGAAPLCWPLAVELDIYEMTGGLGNSDVCASVHHGATCNVDLGNRYGCVPRPRDDGTFHVYAVRWSAASGVATWFLDGVPFHSSSSTQAPLPAGGVALVLNTALSFFAGEGPPGVGAAGVEHQIDWVRLWEAAS
jgi:beta-glucanase (GH16 family)